MKAVKVAGPAGVRISVELATQAFVYLMDWSHYQSFQSTGTGKGEGGWYAQSPVQFIKPDANDWYVVVYDRQGGNPRHTVKVG